MKQKSRGDKSTVPLLVKAARKNPPVDSRLSERRLNLRRHQLRRAPKEARNELFGQKGLTGAHQL
jgi:hypothetical protein